MFTTRSFSSMLMFCFFVAASHVQGQNMQVHFINVGQGSATLIEFPCGVILIDTGGETNELFQSSDALIAYLDDFFLKRPDLNSSIDLLIISHPHLDHTQSIRDVADRYTIKNAITNGQITGSGKTGQKFLHTLIADREDTPATNDDIGYFEGISSDIPAGGVTNNIIDPINCDGADPVIKLLWGRVPTNPGWSKDDFEDENNHSIVCKIDFGQSSLITTGDLETKAIGALMAKHNNTSVFDSDVCLVGHHGSKNGATAPFINAVSPEIAVLSFGNPDRELIWTAWAHGHPNQEIVNMLASKVSKTRPTTTVKVGLAAKSFTTMQLSKAVYGIGWDNSVVLTATLNGEWSNKSEQGQLNINEADLVALQTLPSIGATRAQAILTHRGSIGRFNDMSDVDDVPGIGPATVTLLRPLIRFQ